MAERHASKRRARAHPRARQGRKPHRVQRTTRLANVGALTVGGAAIAAASAIGVGELTLGLFAAYVAYRVIRYGIAPTEAIIEGVELEHGEIPRSESNVA